MSSPLYAADRVCERIAARRDDVAHELIRVDADDLPDDLDEYGEGRQDSATGRPYFLVPLGLLAHYAVGRDPAGWMT